MGADTHWTAARQPSAYTRPGICRVFSYGALSIGLYQKLNLMGACRKYDIDRRTNQLKGTYQWAYFGKECCE